MLRHLSKKTAPEAMRRFDWHALSEVQLLGSNPNSNPNPNPNPAPNLLQGEEREEKEPPPARLECAMVQQGEATKTENKPWTYDENETLLMLVRDPTLADRRGRPKWAQVAKGLPGRSAQEARCRWRRISDAETRRKRGETFHNRCRTCGQLRRGHICPGAPPAAAPPAAAPPAALLERHRKSATAGSKLDLRIQRLVAKGEAEIEPEGAELSAEALVVDGLVWGEYRGDKVWYPGQVVRRDGQLLVQFDDGETDHQLTERRWRSRR